MAGNLNPLNYFTGEQIEVAKNYKSPKYVMFLIENLLLFVFLLIFIFTSAGVKVNSLCENLVKGKITCPFFGFILISLWLILIFPINFYRGFLYERKFGLSEQPFKDWLFQYILSDVIFIIFFVVSVTIFYTVVKRFPKTWWLFSATGFAVFVIAGAYLLPVMIMPLFNKFTPLPPGELRNITIDIGKKAGIGNIEEIYIMDASRQTKKANAYFVGLGGTTRIVLYDTLKNYSIHETASIIAHEGGHWKHRHIIKGIFLTTISGLLFFFLLYLFFERYGNKFGFSSAYDIKTLPFILFLVFFINITTLPIQNSISRYFERQSDMTSLEITNNPDAMISLQKKLALQNMSEITPAKFTVWYLFTHPPVMERIEMAERFKGK